MARCEDYPCCGHTDGDPCPEVDKDGNIVPRCVECGGKLPTRARSSICAGCQRRMVDNDNFGDDFSYDRNT